ncbi:M56 family metallopeptidase [Hanstruepera ponticola]|uniref:M56 family metallopeptidase n=1 Tax=Hanstruepera ponticola TaxID=2042995 RepID=UPI000CF18EC3|nr:M56 family metallopeptidase [Hanstruepera ponticola]
MDYLLKSSAIIALFYLSYRLFLQRETFFGSNRWYLFIGLVTAALLPTLVIPVYIEYTPIVNSSSVYFAEATTSTPEPFDWAKLMGSVYIVGLIFFSCKLIIELLSLRRLINNNPKIKMGRFSLIEIFDKIAPFSFFNWIVYNPKQFKKQELNLIINHEKVHAKEFHTIDILLAHVCCTIFWFNPLVWLYKKELQQNLEFIADQKAQTISDSKESYQKLLLKASVPHQQLALTNNFYNSLIKKRIIMLHKSKSKKQKAWKYALIIPALALFLMSFNTKEIYIPKNTESNTILEKEFIITPTSSNSELEIIKNYFKNKPVQVQFAEIVRNSDNLIQSITLNTKYKDGTDYTKRMTVSEKNIGIPSFKLAYSPKSDDIVMHVLQDDTQTDVSKQQIRFGNEKTIAKLEPKKSSKKEDVIGENPLYVIGNKQYKKEDLPSKKLSTNGSIEQLSKKEGEKRFGKAGKEGAIIFNGKTTFNNTEKVTLSKRGDILITKDFSEADLNLAKAQLEKEGLKTKIRGVKRNSNGEIIAIKIEVSSEHSKANFNLNDDGPINPIQISFDKDGKNISIGSGNMHKSHVYAYNIKDKGDKRARFRSRNNAYVISTENHDHDCKNDCDHEVEYEFHNGDHKNHENEEVIVRGTNSYVIKNSNTNNGKRVVTITNEDGEDEIIELKSDKNVYVLKSKDGVISSNHLTWVNDDNAKAKYEFKSKKKGNSFFISTDEEEKPYILLNGKEITQKEMEALDSETIKSVNVLKGESATKKYGNKAKDGAIIISTKE